MTNRDFVRYLANAHPGMFLTDARKIIKTVFDALRSALLAGNHVYIPEVGTIYAVYLDGREGKPWKTPNGIATTLKNRVRIKIKPSRKLMEILTTKFFKGEVELSNLGKEN